MLTRRTVYLAALGVTLGVSPSAPAAAQPTTATAEHGATPALQMNYTRIWFNAGDRKVGANGLGARLMWQPFAAADGSSTVKGVWWA